MSGMMHVVPSIGRVEPAAPPIAVERKCEEWSDWDGSGGERGGGGGGGGGRWGEGVGKREMWTLEMGWTQHRVGMRDGDIDEGSVDTKHTFMRPQCSEMAL